MRAHPDEDRSRALVRLRAWLEENCRDSLVAFPAAAWIVSAAA